MEKLSDPTFHPNRVVDTTPANPTRVMPALAPGKHSHRHSVHSALATLAALQVSASRITLERVGRAAEAPDTVLAQIPAPGEPLLPGTQVRLRIAGLGFTHALPVGMWDSGGETHLGTRELLEGLDDPLEKLKHWFHEGAPLFRLHPNDPAACARWLGLFGMEAAEWPPSLWYRLATLVASLPQYSCSAEGCAFVLETLLGLPVQEVRYRPSFAQLPEAMCSRLGRRASRLGVDLLLGAMAEEPADAEVEIGPISIDLYERFAENAEGATLLRRVLELVMPVTSRTQLSWNVLDKQRAPQLGVAGANSRLGINTHMGAALAMFRNDREAAQPEPSAAQSSQARTAPEQPAPVRLQL